MTQPIRWLKDEIADRMLQKLDIVKLAAKDILLMPDFPGIQFVGDRFIEIEDKSFLEFKNAVCPSHFSGRLQKNRSAQSA
jgi:hypothetical protein